MSVPAEISSTIFHKHGNLKHLEKREMKDVGLKTKSLLLCTSSDSDKVRLPGRPDLCS